MGGVPGHGGNGGRVAGWMLVGVAVLVAGAAVLPLASAGHGQINWYSWRITENDSAVPGQAFLATVFGYVLAVLLAGTAGAMLAAGGGDRRNGVRWLGAFAAGFGTAIAGGDVLAFASPGNNVSLGPGYWLLALALPISLAAFVIGVRAQPDDTAVRAPAHGRVTDGLTGGFLLLAAVVGLVASFLPQSEQYGMEMTVWHEEGYDATPLRGSVLAVAVFLSAVMAILLFSGLGVRDSRVRIAGGFVAATLFGAVLTLMLPSGDDNGWLSLQHATSGFWVMSLATLASIPAVIASVVANISGPRTGVPSAQGFSGVPYGQPQVPGGYAPGALVDPAASNPFNPTVVVANLFAPAPFAADPSAPGVEVPNGFAPAPNPFATGGNPQVVANPFAHGPAMANPFAPNPAVPNPFAANPATPNPFAGGAATPNPFAASPAMPNPFAANPATPNPFAVDPVAVNPAEQTVVNDPELRMAKVYDGRDEQGRPVVNRSPLEENSRSAVLAYLESAPIVLAARSTDQDEFVPGDRDVPLTFRTDGVWVWAGAVPHYLHKHGLPPEPELVAHIVARGFRVGEVSDAAKDRAVRAITTG